MQSTTEIQRPIRLGLVVSEFHREITHEMELLAKEHAQFLGAQLIKVIYAPGVFDIPLLVSKLIQSPELDAVVTLGCVIQGQTQHDQVIMRSVTRKLLDLSIQHGKPVTLGISGPGMTRIQALERVEYAKRAVEAAVKLVERLRKL